MEDFLIGFGRYLIAFAKAGAKFWLVVFLGGWFFFEMIGFNYITAAIFIVVGFIYMVYSVLSNPEL